MAKQFQYPFRVGRKQKRALLDADGIEVTIFPIGAEDLAQLVCDLLNKNSIECRPPLQSPFYAQNPPGTGFGV